MTATAKLFRHGGSQAVRLPKDFRLPGTEVRISRDGDKVVLEPVEGKFDVEAWRRDLEALNAKDFLSEGLPDDPPLEPDDSIDFDAFMK